MAPGKTSALTAQAFKNRAAACVEADNGSVFFTAHAKARMAQRRITDAMVLETLRRGYVVEGPALDMHGNWKATMKKLVAGVQVRVAAAIDEGVIVITVF
jgi:hypothetical protein